MRIYILADIPVPIQRSRVGNLVQAVECHRRVRPESVRTVIAVYMVEIELKLSGMTHVPHLLHIHIIERAVFLRGVCVGSVVVKVVFIIIVCQPCLKLFFVAESVLVVSAGRGYHTARTAL